MTMIVAATSRSVAATPSCRWVRSAALALTILTAFRVGKARAARLAPVETAPAE